ncbi:MAG TPA: zinc-binding alcohol dehydrogenase family protein [Thermoleophilaceae bacterium]|nr:zinc-binding alcohol dehydrogenase family protein [Thermoleophilaceae bacterium]
MRAAVLSEYGVPSFGQFDEPEPGDGQAVVEVSAAGLNPVDVVTATGQFYEGPPPLPSVPGKEGVGVLDGRRVYFGASVQPFGSMAERALVEPQNAFDLPDDLDDGLAVALGIAGLAGWLPLSWRARLEPGEHVLVLGASGVVGQIAVQAARLLGAGRLVAGARSREGLERARELGADEVVSLDQDADSLEAAIREAAGDRLDVVVDPLWAEPAVAAMKAARKWARIVQLGQSAGAEATIASSTVRGKSLTIMGHSNFAVPLHVRAEAYATMAAHAAAGKLRIDVEKIPLEEVEQAFARQKESPNHKLVLVP